MINNRFHIVTANFEKLRCFVVNFGRIKGFNPKIDCVYIFDCSSEKVWRSELAIAQDLCQYGLEWNKNLFFIRRRNWGVNHGAQLDYFRAIMLGLIPQPKLSAFMQEHFLDLENYVKEDTLPENCSYDLNEIEDKFNADAQVGCVFHARSGVRVTTSNPGLESGKVFFGDSEILFARAIRRSFCIDGGNFIVRPETYLRFFISNPHYLTSGDGTYGFSHVWETRLGRIIYDEKLKWCDMFRRLEYSSIEELDLLEKNTTIKVSKLWYDNPVWYFYYGRDEWKYPIQPLIPILRYLRQFIVAFVRCSRDTQLVFCTPKDIEL